MENIEQNNALIAQFMGCERNKDGTYDVESFYYSPAYTSSSIYDTCEYKPENMQYPCSWDWLMPVVEEIEKLGYWVESRLTYVSIGKQCDEATIFNISFSSLTTTKIEAIYNAVVKFINWYNQNKS